MSDANPSNKTSDNGLVYQIRVEGKLDEGWSNWFNGMTITLEGEVPPVTSLTGELVDQASLRGLLTLLWDLNLSLISVNQMFAR